MRWMVYMFQSCFCPLFFTPSLPPSLVLEPDPRKIEKEGDGVEVYTAPGMQAHF